MKENSKDYKFCIKLALDNAKKRINLLDDSDKKCVLEEYKEWINDGLNKDAILLIFNKNLCKKNPMIMNSVLG